MSTYFMTRKLSPCKPGVHLNRMNSVSAATNVLKSSSKLNPSFINILCKKGIKRETELADINTRLKLTLQVDNPIQKAIDVIKPILTFKKQRGKFSIPVVLTPKQQESTAIRWIIKSGSNRKYFGRPIIEMGIYDEIVSILQGTSPLFAKRYHFHRNPITY